MSIRVNGSTVTRASYRTGGSWRALSAGWAKKDGAWLKVFPYIPPAPPITGATINPSSRQWSTNNRASFTGAPIGGAGPFYYEWQPSSGVSIVSGQGTSSVTVQSSTGTTTSLGLTIFDEGSGTSFTAARASITQIPVVQPLSASVSPASRSWSGSLNNFTATFTGSGSGGSGSYSYAWTVSGGTITAGQGTSSVTVASNSGAAASVTLTLSDNSLGQATTASGSVSAVVWPALSVSVAPSSVSASGSTPVLVSGSATATISGGSGAYSGGWEWDQGASSGSIVPSNTSALTTTFQSNGDQAPGSVRYAGFRYRVTDLTTGAVAVSSSVQVTLTRSHTPMVVSVAPSSLSGSGASAPVQTSGSATVSVSGGSGSWTVAWLYDGSGTGGFNPVSNTSATTAFVSSGSMPLGATYTGGFYPRVTDTITGEVSDGPSVSVTLSRAYAPLSVSVSPSALAGAGTSAPVQTSGSATVSVSGGSGSWTVAWLYDGSGTGGFNPVSNTSATTAFVSASSIPAGATYSGGFYPRVTDTVTGQTADGPSVQVTLTRNFAALSASVAPSSLSGSGASAPVQTSGSATVSVSGGSGSWTVLWEFDGSGTGGIIPTSDTAASTAFTSGSDMPVGASYSAGFRARVRDTVTGQVVVSNSVAVAVSRTAPALSVTISPSSQPWPANAPFRVSSTANAQGGVPPYSYAWNDTGPLPYPSGSGYAGQSKTWQSAGGRDPATLSVVVTDSTGATANAGAVITDL